MERWGGEGVLTSRGRAREIQHLSTSSQVFTRSVDASLPQNFDHSLGHSLDDYAIAETFHASARFQDSDFFTKATKMVLSMHFVCGFSLFRIQTYCIGILSALDVRRNWILERLNLEISQMKLWGLLFLWLTMTWSHHPAYELLWDAGEWGSLLP